MRESLCAVAILFGGLCFTSADLAQAVRSKCRGRYCKANGKSPKYYDKFVRVTHYVPKGADRGCLERLKAAKIRFRMLDRVKGVRTPVWVKSKRLGGVLYRRSWNNKRRFILDCSMVETLVAMGREIRKAGIASVYVSSSWRYSVVSGTSARISQHGHGLALDVPAIDGTFGYASVIKHYERGKWGCGSLNKTAKGKALRKFFCALRKRRAFRRIITPDMDRHHRDHLHIEQPNPAVKAEPVKPRRR